jgi:KDO2-lipid IV(A) lauroyltransferase
VTGAARRTAPAGRSGDGLAFLPVRALRAALRDRDPAEAIDAGARWGRRVAALGGSVTDVARINMGIAFPEWDVEARERLLFDAYASVGRGVAELALLQGRHRGALLDAVRLEGVHHLAAAVSASPTGGVLVVTAHYGTWDLYAAAIAQRGYALSVVQRGFSSPRLEAMMTRIRIDGGGDLEEIRMGPRAGADLLAALRRGRIGIALLDQNARAGEGVFVPFFSRLACTRFAPAVIAMRRRVPVLPVFGHREGTGSGHVVRIGAPIEIAPGPGHRRDPDQARLVAENVARMTRPIEDAIRSGPEHWLWSQRRWRTRPPGPPAEHAALYPDRRGWLRAVRRAVRRWRAPAAAPRDPKGA